MFIHLQNMTESIAWAEVSLCHFMFSAMLCFLKCRCVLWNVILIWPSGPPQFTVCYDITACSDWVKKTKQNKQRKTWRQLWRYKRLHMEYCYMALEEQRRSFLWIEASRGISVLLSCKGPLSNSPPGQSGPNNHSSFHRKHNLNTLSEAEVTQDNGRLDLPWHNKSFPSHFSGSQSTIMSISHPPCQFPLSYHSQSFFSLFFYWPV